MSRTYTAYTDGSSFKCKNTKKHIGGIGVFFDKDDPRNISLDTSKFMNAIGIPCESKVTNNMSELSAILVALKIFKPDLKNGKSVVIKSDSMYSINCLTNWYQKWIRMNWVNSQDKPVMNMKLIKYILKNYILKYPNQITFIHVRAHQREPPKSSKGWCDWYGNQQADYFSTHFNC